MFRRLIGRLFSLLDWVSDLLVRPGKWLERIFYGALQSADVLSRDSWFNRIVVWIFEPVRWVFSRLDRVLSVRFARKDDASGLDDAEVVRTKLERSEKLTDIQKRLKRSWISRIGQLLIFPLVALLTLLYLILRSRTGGRILVPVFALVFAVGVLSYFLISAGVRTGMARKYEEAVVVALANKDFSTAELYRRKLEQLGGQSNVSQYRTALALNEEGKSDLAYASMLGIAPESTLGFPPAHLWLAGKLLQGDLPMSTNAAISKAMLHLKLAESFPPLADRVHYLRGMALVRVNSLGRAEEELTLAAAAFPEAAYTLLELQILNRSDAVRETARIVQRHLAAAVVDGPSQEAQMMASVHVEMALGDFDSLNRSIDNWKVRAPESDRNSERLARLNLFLVSRWLDAGQVESVGTALAQLEQATSALTDDLEEVRRILSKIWINRETEKGRRLYEGLLDQENANSNVIEFFASAIAGQENWESSRDFLYQAIRLDPDNSRALNNLAHILSRFYPDKMNEAFEYANHAVELEPNDARLRETRGYIAMQKKMWETVIEDYAIAINGLGNRAELLNGLADAYFATGDDYRGEMFRSSASRIERSRAN